MKKKLAAALLATIATLGAVPAAANFVPAASKACKCENCTCTDCKCSSCCCKCDDCK